MCVSTDQNSSNGSEIQSPRTDSPQSADVGRQPSIYSAIHVGIRWKMWTEDKSKTDITKTKHSLEQESPAVADKPARRESMPKLL